MTICPKCGKDGSAYHGALRVLKCGSIPFDDNTDLVERSELCEARERVAQLEEWKRQAVEVFNQTNFETIAKEIEAVWTPDGGWLGSSISKQILPAIKAIKSENQRLRKLVGEAFDAGTDWTRYDDAIEGTCVWPVPKNKQDFLRANGLGEG